MCDLEVCASSRYKQQKPGKRENHRVLRPPSRGASWIFEAAGKPAPGAAFRTARKIREKRHQLELI